MTTLAGSAVAQSLNTWTDLSGFSALRHEAQTNSAAVLPVVAKQFESIFTQMMLKSMRAADFGDPLTGSKSGDMWQGLFDQQLAVTLSQKGQGLGIATMLEHQLGGTPAPVATPVAPGDDSNLAQLAATRPQDDWKQRLGAVADAVQSTGSSVVRKIPNDAKEFVEALAPYATQAARMLGVSLRAVLAQAALETKWGTHMPTHADGSSSNNLFGIKAGGSWDGGRVSVPTLEFDNGVAVRRQAQFRSYESPKQSFQDYANLLTSDPRYASALGKGDDVLGFARGLVEGGYATDPGYAAKVTALANSPLMRQALDALKKVVKLPTPAE